MPRMQMLITVLQALALDALAIIISHYTWRHTARQVQDYEFFAPPDHYAPTPNLNWTELHSAFNSTLSNSTGFNSSNSNSNSNLNSSIVGNKATVHNVSFSTNVSDIHTFGTMIGELEGGGSFWWKSLPKQMVPLLLLVPLNYFWMIWLEKILPGRRKSGDGFTDSGSTSSSSVGMPSTGVMAEKMGMMEDEAAEEEIVKRWIARGKVQRASLSWWNTFLKWALDLSLGNAWRVLVDFAVEAVVRRLTWEKAMENFWLEYFGNFFLHTFCINSLGTVISFVLVPAYKRVVFISFSSLVWTIFFHAGLNLLLPWVLRQSWMQEIIRNANEANRNASMAAFRENQTLELTYEFTPDL